MNLSIDDSLKKKNSDFAHWTKGVNSIVIEKACPRCGSDLVCAYAEMGTTEFCDTYNHICMDSQCDFILKKDEFGIGMGDREVNGPTLCPFCHRNVL